MSTDIPTVRRAGVVRDAPRVRTARWSDLAGAIALSPEGAAALAAAVADGRARGFEEGYRDGRDAAAGDVADLMVDEQRRVAEACAALGAAVFELRAREVLALDDVAEAIVQGALGVAEAILGREVATARSPGADALVRALALAPRGPAMARLHPDDAATLAREDRAVAPDITIVADPTVERGGCILAAGPRHIDAQLHTALDRVREALA